MIFIGGCSFITTFTLRQQHGPSDLRASICIATHPSRQETSAIRLRIDHPELDGIDWRSPAQGKLTSTCEPIRFGTIYTLTGSNTSGCFINFRQNALGCSVVRWLSQPKPVLHCANPINPPCRPSRNFRHATTSSFPSPPPGGIAPSLHPPPSPKVVQRVSILDLKVLAAVELLEDVPNTIDPE